MEKQGNAKGAFMLAGLEYIMAGYVQLASGQVECKLKKAPEISVAASDTKVKYDHSKSKAQLQGFDIDTVSPYAPNVQTHVGGLMSGEVRISQNTRFMQETYPTINAGCLYIDKIDIKIHVDPTIYIAKDYPYGSCMYNAVIEHEKKHVQVDRAIVNKYTKLIVQAVDTTMKRVGYSHGPFLLQKLPSQQEILNANVNKVVKQYSDQMNIERKQLQQQVDSIQEYDRVNSLCKGQ